MSAVTRRFCPSPALPWWERVIPRPTDRAWRNDCRSILWPTDWPSLAGAKLGATWEDVWEELPENIRLALTPARPDESKQAETASLFPVDSPLSPHKRRIFALLKADEATHIDETVDRLETEMSSFEIFAALFELELAGKVRQLPGKNFVKTF
jgi:predicted Rossmann fold nucleotide-binding protein DprA/Smf involved in DNA uptake